MFHVSVEKSQLNFITFLRKVRDLFGVVLNKESWLEQDLNLWPIWPCSPSLKKTRAEKTKRELIKHSQEVVVHGSSWPHSEILHLAEDSVNSNKKIWWIIILHFTNIIQINNIANLWTKQRGFKKKATCHLCCESLCNYFSLLVLQRGVRVSFGNPVLSLDTLFELGVLFRPIYKWVVFYSLTYLSIEEWIVVVVPGVQFIVLVSSEMNLFHNLDLSWFNSTSNCNNGMGEKKNNNQGYESLLTKILENLSRCVVLINKSVPSHCLHSCRKRPKTA